MTSIYQFSHKNFKRWHILINRSLGVQLDIKILLLVFSTLLILISQCLIYFALSSQTIYCHLPNMRLFYQCGSEKSYEKLPTIYVITPTYFRHVQKAELVRLSHTLLLVPNVHWIIVEDSDWSTDIVTKLVRRLKSEFDFHSITQLNAQTPEEYKLKPGDPSWRQPKGIWQRNKALAWIRQNSADLDPDGVIYFADDDNTYDLELFHEMRFTRKVSVWPVGLVGGMMVEKPIVKGSRIHSFNARWASKRPFPIDMAGFAISMRLFMSSPSANFSAEQKIGYVESHFLGQLVQSWDDLEPKADGCSKVLVWHTQTKKPSLHEEKHLNKTPTMLSSADD